MVVLTGGGTGGHLAGVRVLKDAFVERGVSPVFVGTDHGQDRDWFANERGFAASYFLPVRGVVDRNPALGALSVARLPGAIWRASRVLRRHRIHAVVSVGAYPAAPAVLSALLRGTPLFFHEHNAVAGRLHRMLESRATAVFSSFDPRSPVRDYPVAAAFFSTRRVRTRLDRVLFLGGSQGARAVNDFALQVAPSLLRAGIQVSHQTGARDFTRVRDAYRARDVEVDVFDFDVALAERMGRADFCVSRAGAGTLFELAANGLPALFVPYPHAARDHQYANARFLADRGLALVAREAELTPDLLHACLEKDLEPLSRGLAASIRPGGARQLVGHILDLLGGRGGGGANRSGCYRALAREPGQVRSE